VNKHPAPATFHLRVEAAQGGTSVSVVVASPELTLAPLEGARVPVFVSVPRADYRGPFALAVAITDDDTGGRTTPGRATARFLGPSAPP
jgi:hypothetical protein